MQYTFLVHYDFEKKLETEIFFWYVFLSILTLTMNICLFDNIECLPGYIGMNCSSKCPFPSYGTICQDTCNCSDEQCDVTTGCNTVTTGNVHLYIHVMVFIIYHQFN